MNKLTKLNELCLTYASQGEEIHQLHQKEEQLTKEIDRLKGETELTDEAGLQKLAGLQTQLTVLPAAISRREAKRAETQAAIKEAWSTEKHGIQQLIIDTHSSAVAVMSTIIRPFCSSEGGAGDVETKDIVTNLAVVMELRRTIPSWGHASFSKGGNEGTDFVAAGELAVALFTQFEAAKVAFEKALRSIAPLLPKA